MSNYTYHGTSDLIALPGRSVQTFPSGLVRVERSFACRRGQEANFRSLFAQGKTMPLDDGKPAIDGLYIFPDPQETARDDGFVEFRVTAYGRTNLIGSYAIRNTARLFVGQFLLYTAEDQAENRSASTRDVAIGDIVISSATVRRVAKLTDTKYTDFVPAEVAIRYAESGINVEDIGIIPSENGVPEDFFNSDGSSASKPISPTVRTQTSDASIQEFGIWQEVIYTVTPILNFYAGIFRGRSMIYFANDLLRPQITEIADRFITIEFGKPVNATTAVIEVGTQTIKFPIGVTSAFSAYSNSTGRHTVYIRGLEENTSYSVKMTYYNDVSSAVALNTTITTKIGALDIGG